jgi:hypothetical protein
MTLRKTHKTWHKAKETAERLKVKLNERFSDEVLYEKFCANFITEEKELSEDEIIL